MSVIVHNSNHVAAIKVQIPVRSFLLFTIYMPTDDKGSVDNLVYICGIRVGSLYLGVNM